jgi:hypothetical protein
MAWSRSGVVRALSAFAFFRGRVPVHADWNQRMDGWPSLETVELLFGSLEAATRAARGATSARVGANRQPPPAK